ncbi:MAG: transcription termination/antitermination factor NusG [Dehalococcoidia bacterium]|nr:MAG: transcription termination/antitermination factor NusG [Dehalococcoidia bacterium]
MVNETASTAAGDKPEATDDGRAWYIVQTYSGYENKVKTSLEQRVKAMDLSDRIFQVFIPTQDEIEIKNGQRKTVSHKRFPGYVFVQMRMDDNTWYVVRHTPGVTGFASTTSDSQQKPTPMADAEVEQLMRDQQVAQPRVNIGFTVGESVVVTSGPFSDMIGMVDSLDMERGRVRVMVSMFGRETPVELDFLEVQKR